jgi:hypothetical protein
MIALRLSPLELARPDHIGDPARALDPAFDPVRERDHEDRRRFTHKHEQRLRPVRHEARKPGYAGSARIVRIEHERIEARLCHRRAHAREAGIEHGITVS